MNKLIGCCAAVVALFPGTVLANGFLLYEFGPLGTAQAGAAVAGIDDPSMVFMNPAHIVNLDGLRLEVGATTYLSTASFTNVNGLKTNADFGVHVTPYGFATYKFYKYLAAGVGAFTSYGLGVTWPKGWEGNGIVRRADIQSTTINPVLAFKIPRLEGLSFGGGVQILWGQAYLEQGLNLVDQWGYSKLGGSKWTVGWNLGARYQPVRWVAAGIVYRSDMSLALKDAHMSFDVPEELRGQFPDQNVAVTMNLPGSLVAGVRAYPTKKLEIEFDFVWVWWSVNKELVIDFSKDTPQDRVVMRRDWSDACQLRLGAQYTINPSWRVAAGLIYDQNPVPSKTLDPSLPDNHRIDVTLGAVYAYKGFNVGLSYMLVYIFDRTVKAAENVLPGTYRTIVHNLSLALGYRFL